jgi:hypothetical protein
MRKRVLLPVAKFSLIVLIVSSATLFTSCATVPVPSSGLPRPYSSTQFEANSPEQEAYFQYLRTTPLLPDREFCLKILDERLSPDVDRPSLKLEWTEDSILAQGTCCAGFFVLTEAHLTYRDDKGMLDKATFSCFVQYPKQTEKSAWRSGKIKYGGCTEKGHRSYIMCPVRLPWAEVPDPSARWQEDILSP